MANGKARIYTRPDLPIIVAKTGGYTFAFGLNNPGWHINDHNPSIKLLKYFGLRYRGQLSLEAIGLDVKKVLANAGKQQVHV